MAGSVSISRFVRGNRVPSRAGVTGSSSVIPRLAHRSVAPRASLLVPVFIPQVASCPVAVFGLGQSSLAPPGHADGLALGVLALAAAALGVVSLTLWRRLRQVQTRLDSVLARTGKTDDALVPLRATSRGLHRLLEMVCTPEQGLSISEFEDRLIADLTDALPGCETGVCRGCEAPPPGIATAIHPFDREGEHAGVAWLRRLDGAPPSPAEREVLGAFVRAYVHKLARAAEDDRRDGLVARLRDAELQSRRLFESVPVPMWVFSTTTLRFIRVNQAAIDRYGFSREEWAGMTLEDIRPPEDIPAIKREIEEIRRHGEPANTTVRHRGKCGEIMWMEVCGRGAPFIGPDARVVVCLDVTPREVEKRSMARHATELSRTNEELDRFAAIASHDLQEPLRMIASFTGVLRDRLAARLGAEESAYFEFIADGASRMQRLMHDLLQYSRAGSRPVRVMPVDTKRAVRLAMVNLHIELAQSGASVECQALPCVAGDETLLVIVFQNLIGNAIKHRAAAVPRIRIDAERQGSLWRFRVVDNGRGVRPELRTHVLELFRRGETDADGPKGSGLGLAICQRVLDRLGGKIWLDSGDDDIGLAVCFTLPAAMPGELAADSVRELKPPLPSEHAKPLTERST